MANVVLLHYEEYVEVYEFWSITLSVPSATIMQKPYPKLVFFSSIINISVISSCNFNDNEGRQSPTSPKYISKMKEETKEE